MQRFWLWVVWCAWAFLNTVVPAQGQPFGQAAIGVQQFPAAIDLSTPQQTSRASSGSLFAPASIAVLQDAPIDLTIDQVAAFPASSFELFNPRKAYSLNAKKSLWLHFSAIGPAAAPTLKWTFELPKPFVDRVELYHRNAQGGWDKQQAGDALPQAQWAIRGLHPQFELPLFKAGQNDFYVKVSQLLPLRFDVTLKPAESAGFDNQNVLLVNGLLLGLMLFVAMFALVLSITYGNPVYGWYAVYVLFAFFAVASYVGVASYAFWPTSLWLPEISHGVFLTFAIAAQLQFCRVLFINPRAAPRTNLFVLICTLIMLSTVVRTLTAPATEIDWRVRSLSAVVVIGTLLMFGLVSKAVFQRRPIAWLWMLAYVPVVAVLILTMIEQFGIAPIHWLPFNAIGMAMGFEVLVLLIALHLHVKSIHAWDVRQMTLVELDPLTGFLAPLYFPDTLAQLWSEARHAREDIAVAYVRAEIDLDGKRGAVQATDDEIVLRCVRMLRMVTRPNDTVARIGGNMFAILMPRMSTGSNLAGKLSRLVALGVMRDSDDATQLLVRFKVAATTFSSFSGTSKQLDEALKENLSSLTAASERTIEFVRG